MKIKALEKHELCRDSEFPYVYINYSTGELDVGSKHESEKNSWGVDEHNGFCTRISITQNTDGDELTACLNSEEMQALIKRVTAGYEEKYNGSNYVGELSEDAYDALVAIEVLLLDIEVCDDVYSLLEDYLNPSYVRGRQMFVSVGGRTVKISVHDDGYEIKCEIDGQMQEDSDCNTIEALVVQIKKDIESAGAVINEDIQTGLEEMLERL